MKAKIYTFKILETLEILKSSLLEATWAEMGPEKVVQELEDKYAGNLSVMRGIVDRQLGKANKINDPEIKEKSLQVIEKIKKVLDATAANTKKPDTQQTSSSSSQGTEPDDDALHEARVKAAKHVSKKSYDAAIDSDGDKHELKGILAKHMENEGRKPEDGIDAASGHVAGALHETKSIFLSAGKEAGYDDKEVKEALKEEGTHSVLQRCGYSIKRAHHYLEEAASHKAHQIFNAIGMTKVAKTYKSGVTKASEVLDKHPVLKKVTGPIVAGAMFVPS